MKVEIDGVEYIPNPFMDESNKYEQALNAKAKHTDYPDISIRDYLHTLLSTLWLEGEGFSGKRPLGNSGWQYDLKYSLIDCGYIPGTITLDEQGWVEDAKAEPDVDWIQLVANLIQYFAYGASQG